MAELMRVLNAALLHRTVATGNAATSFLSLVATRLGLCGRYRQFQQTIYLDATTVVAHFVLQSSPRKWHPHLVATKLLARSLPNRNYAAAFARAIGLWP